ncbi:MAG: carboxypeptidase regulatory-like domain-containing protein [Phycisphaerae bacterium]|nr:carboxypeptidase regulatory-like domain-containing protein [Phycisphaerae bacterium]
MCVSNGWFRSGIRFSGMNVATRGMWIVVLVVGCVVNLGTWQQAWSGSIEYWGWCYDDTCEGPTGSDFITMAAAYNHSLALKDNGTIIAWGNNWEGECNVPAGNDFVAVAAGYCYSLALRSSGELVAWGGNWYGQCNVPGGTDFIAIGAGDGHGMALKADGSIVVWGESGSGQCNVPAGNDFNAIAAGGVHCLALRTDGSIVAWGGNNCGQCNTPAGNDFIAISAGQSHSLALKADRSIVAWGANWYEQCDVPAGNSFIAISAGHYHSLALRTYGSVVAWGYGHWGQCDVPEASIFMAVAAGGNVSLALSGEIELGACCDRSVLICHDDVMEPNCKGPQQEWSHGTLCADLDPPCTPCDLSGMVYDASTGDPIAEAEVTLPGGASTLTDAQGEFSFTGLPCDEIMTLTVTKNAYHDVSETFVLLPDLPTFLNIPMTPKPLEVLEVHGTYCGPDKHVYYLDGVSLEETFTATIAWRGHEPDHVRWITPQMSHEDACPDTTVARSFNMGSDFGENELLTVIAVSGDDPPVESEPYVTNFKVIPLPPGLSSEGWMVQASNQLKYVQAVQEVSLPMEGVGGGAIPDWVPIFGGEPYQVGIGFKLSPEVQGDGTGTAGIGKLSTSGSAPSQFGGGDWEFSIGGKATWKYDGTTWQPGGSLEIGLNASKNLPSKPKYVILWVWIIPVPLYWQGKVGVDSEASIGFEDWTADPLLPTLNGQFTVKPSAGIRGGVGAADVAAVEGNLVGYAPLVLQYPAEPTLKSVSVGLTGSLKLVVWKYTKEWPILDYKWDLYTGGTDPLADKLRGWDDWSEFGLLPRDYIGAHYAEFYPDGVPTSPRESPARGTESTLQANVFPYLAPCLVAVGEDARLVWLYDDPQRTSVNGTEVVFSASTDDLWSSPVAVADDGTADFAPTLAVLPSGDLLAAWENADMVLPEETDLETMVSHLEIAVAGFDETTQTWSSQVNLTSNGYMDRSPRLSAADNGQAMLTWVSNASNHPIGTATEPNTVHYCLWDGSAWSAPGVVAAAVPSIVKSAMAFDGSGALYLYSADMDNDLATVDDRELYAVAFDGATWSAPQRLTNDPDIIDDNPQVVATGAGQFLFAWFRGEAIVTAGSIDLADLAVAAETGLNGGAMDFRLARSGTGQMTLVWQMASQEAVDVWQSLYDAGLNVWSKPVQLTFNDTMERFMSPAYLATGDLMIAYGKQQVSYETRTLLVGDEEIVLENVPVPGQTDLCLLQHTAGLDLAVFAEDVTLTPENPAGGETAAITATIRNVGELPVTGVDVAFYDGDPGAGGVQIGSIQTIAGPLVGGDEAEVSVDWVVPDSTEPHDVYVVIDPYLAQADCDRTNNTDAAVGVMKPDLLIDSILVQSVGPADRIITIRVANAGVLEISNFDVTLRRDAEDGDMLTTLCVTDPLPSGAYHDVSWVWEDAAPFPEGSVDVFAIAEEADAIDEFDEDNNVRQAVLRNDEVAFDCNLNGYDDASDIAAGTSEDYNTNGIPDECEPAFGQILLRTGEEPGVLCVGTEDTFTVTLEVADLDYAINGVQALIHYDAAHLALASITPAPNWVLITPDGADPDPDGDGDLTCALYLPGGEMSSNGTVATLLFDPAAEGATNVTFQADNAPFHTKLTRVCDNTTIMPGKVDSGTISIDDTVATASNNGPTFCEGDTIELSGGPSSGPLGPYTYSWTGPDGFSSSEQSPTISDATLAMSGTYYLIVANTNGCEFTAQTDVTVELCMVVNVEIEGLIGDSGSYGPPSGDGSEIDREVTFVFTDCDGAAETFVVPVAFTADVGGNKGVGSVQFTGLDANLDWLGVQEGHTLRTLVAVDFVGTLADSVTVFLTSGDFHTGIVPQDNLVDITDFSILASDWETVIGADESIGGDATGDGYHDADDFALIQPNFFEMGDAVNGCSRVGRVPSAAGVGRVPPAALQVGVGVISRTPRASIRVSELNLAVAHAERADVDSNGVIDARDIRAFARRHNLRLQPSFDAKLTELEEALAP